MRLPLVLAAAALVLTACSKKPQYVRYEDPTGFSADVPASWPKTGDKDLTRKPVAMMSWVGADRPQDEGQILGAVLHVTRVSRRREDLPPKQSWDKYAAQWLAPSDRLFAGKSGDVAEYANETTVRHDGGLHAPQAIPIKAVAVVLRTPDAYWVLNYTATKDNFDKYAAAFERLKATAKPGR